MTERTRTLLEQVKEANDQLMDREHRNLILGLAMQLEFLEAELAAQRSRTNRLLHTIQELEARDM